MGSLGVGGVVVDVYYQADWSEGLGSWTDSDGNPVAPCWQISGCGSPRIAVRTFRIVEP
jgi:hypothetical protein